MDLTWIFEFLQLSNVHWWKYT